MPVFSVAAPTIARSPGWEAGSAVGLLGGGDLEASSGTTDLDSDVEHGFYSRGHVDYFASPHVGVGAYLDFGTIAGSRSDAAFAGAGVSLKGRYTIHDVVGTGDVSITPGVGVGYRAIDVNILGVDETVSGLALSGGVDVRLHWGQLDLFIEPGVLAQPPRRPRRTRRDARPDVLRARGIRLVVLSSVPPPPSPHGARSDAPRPPLPGDWNSLPICRQPRERLHSPESGERALWRPIRIPLPGATNSTTAARVRWCAVPRER